MDKKGILIIRKFGPVRDLSVEIKPFMVFIGSQGTGKSTVAKVFTILNDVMWHKTIADGQDAKKIFNNYKIGKYFNSDTYIYYSYLDVIITYENAKFTLSGSSARMLCYIPTERSVISTLSASFANIVLNKVPLPLTLLEYLAQYEKAKDYFTEYKSKMLGVTYASDHGEDNFRIDNHQEKWLKLNECSSGIQSVLPMQMIIDYCHETESFNHFVIEEPEENLFPFNQYELVKFFLSHYNGESQAQFIINTHSPYLLTSLNVALLAYKMGTKPEFRDDVEAILPSRYWISPEDVAVYALEADDKYCQSVIDEKAGVISGTFLDSASEIIGNDFNQLYSLYIKSLKNGK